MVNLNNYNELHKEWLKSLYQEEIERTNKELSNQKLWALGCAPEEQEMYNYNLKNLEDFKVLLNELIGNVEECMIKELPYIEECMIKGLPYYEEV